jgi:hypothetical protein
MTYHYPLWTEKPYLESGILWPTGSSRPEWPFVDVLRLVGGHGTRAPAL